MTFLHTPPPQRPGFRKELEQQVQAAIHHQPTMSRSAYLKYAVGLPLVGAAVVGLIIAIQPKQSNTTIASLTATEVHAAVVKSISETFVDLQADDIQYQKIRSVSSGGVTTDYTSENWQTALSRITISTNNSLHQVNDGFLTSRTSVEQGRNCFYVRGGMTYDDIVTGGSYTTEPYRCDEGIVISEFNFSAEATTDFQPTVYLNDEQYLIIQWDTTEPIGTDIVVESLNVSDDPTTPYSHNNNGYTLNPIAPNGLPMPRGLEEEFMNRANDTGYTQSVYLPDLAYANKYLPGVTIKDLYFQVTVDPTTSATYHYHVSTGELTTAGAAELEDLHTQYELSTLEHHEFNSNFDMSKDSAERLMLVQAKGDLSSYHLDDSQLVATYLVADVIKGDMTGGGNLQLSEGTYEFVINQTSGQIQQWSYINSFGAKDTIMIEANTTLADDPADFFNEANFKALLTEHGVQL